MKKHQIFFMLIFLIGIALRVIYLMTPQLDSDQAIVGLMARHILEGEFPIFYWGEHYEGPIESYFAAIIFYLFGSSRLTLNLSPFIFSLIFIFLVYRFSKEMFNEKVGLIAMLLSAISPPYLIWYSVLARGNYIQNLVFGVIILLLTYRMVKKVNDDRERARYYIILGFVCGLAWWVIFQSIYFLITASVFIFLKDRWLSIKRGIIYFFPSFMIGSSLFWYYNLTHSWSSILDIQKYSERLTLSESLASFFKLKLPQVLGPFYGPPLEYLNKYFLIIYGALFLYFILTYRRGILDLFRLSVNRMAGAEVFIVCLTVFSIIIIGWYNWGRTTRYYLPIYTVFPLILAASLYDLRKIFKPIPIFLVILITLSNIYGTVKSAEIFDPKRLEIYKEDMKRSMLTFDLLKEKGLRYVAVTNYWDSFRLTFDSAEEIIFALPTRDWGPNKYPKYTEALDSSRNYAYLWKGKIDADNFERNLISEGMTYTKEKVRNFYIFHSLEISPRRGEGLPVTDMIATSNYTKVDSGRALDRDITTFWQPTGDKGEEVFFQIDMKRPYLVNRISLLNGGVHDGNPSGYELEVSMDGIRWKRIISLPVFFGSFVERTDGIPILDPGRIISVFEPVKAKYIKIKQAPGQPTMNWRIAEIFLYSQSEFRSEEEDDFIKEWNKKSPEIVSNIDFGGELRFLGYDIDKKEIRAGDSFRVTYYWKAMKDVKKEWHAFVHFIGHDGKIAFQNDHLLSSGGKPSSKWIKNEFYKESFIIDVPRGIPSESYQIKIGLWEPKTNKRLKVSRGLPKNMDGIIIGELNLKG